MSILLTTWVVRLHYTSSDVPVGPIYKFLAVNILLPFYYLTQIICCTQTRGKGVKTLLEAKYGRKSNIIIPNADDTNRADYTKIITVVPVEKRNFDKGIHGDELSNKSVIKDLKVHWQDIAEMLDHLFFWLTAISFSLYSIFILTLLYIRY